MFVNSYSLNKLVFMLQLKWFRTRWMIFPGCIMIFVITCICIRSFIGSKPFMSALLDTASKLSMPVHNKTLARAVSLPNVSAKGKQPLSSNYTLSLERRTNCNLKTPNKCFSTQKSLVITFWRQESHQKWLTSNLLSAFPEQHFDYIVMIHDNSSWSHHPAYDKIIWIHVKDQLKFWYIKRFISRHIFSAYRYVWIIDDDARFHFNTRVYECVADTFNISLSAPGRGEGVLIHMITRVSSNYTFRIGRWTDFVEIGPMFIAKASAWVCLWNYLSEKVGLGYGFDNIWCMVLSVCLRQPSVSKTCAILDAFVVHHDSTRINSIPIGVAEMPAYEEYFKNYFSKMLTYGPLAPNTAVLDLCISNLSKSILR